MRHVWALLCGGHSKHKKKKGGEKKRESSVWEWNESFTFFLGPASILENSGIVAVLAFFNRIASKEAVQQFSALLKIIISLPYFFEISADWKMLAFW